MHVHKMLYVTLLAYLILLTVRQLFPSDQGNYLPMLDYTGTTLAPCFNCTSAAITPAGMGFPFGSYYHDSIYVSRAHLNQHVSLYNSAQVYSSRQYEVSVPYS